MSGQLSMFVDFGVRVQTPHGPGVVVKFIETKNLQAVLVRLDKRRLCSPFHLEDVKNGVNG